MKPKRFELAIEGIEYYDAGEMDTWLTEPCVWVKEELHGQFLYTPSCPEWLDAKIDEKSYMGWAGKFCPHCGHHIEVKELRDE